MLHYLYINKWSWGGSRNTQMRLYYLAAKHHHRALKQVPLGASTAASSANKSGICGRAYIPLGTCSRELSHTKLGSPVTTLYGLKSNSCKRINAMK